jgi:hypothetical protein
MLARQPEAGHFGEETLAAAEDLSKQKHELERELEKVEIEIAFRERVVADETRIARVLRQFDDAVKELSFEEQCELVRLIVRGIRVNRLDPEKEPIPGGLSQEERKIRTHWYSVNLDLFANNSLPATCEPSGLGSHLDQNGRAGGIRTRGLLVPNEALYQAEPRPDCDFDGLRGASSWPHYTGPGWVQEDKRGTIGKIPGCRARRSRPAPGYR